MSRGLILAGCFALAALARPVPNGTKLHVRLLTQVSSDKPSGQPVRAVLTVPVLLDENILLPLGLQLEGETADARAAQLAGDSATEKPAQLKLVFKRLTGQSAHATPIECRLIEVDNARETIDQSGVILGITPSQTIEARIDQGIGKLSERNPQLGQLLGTLRSSFVKKVDPSITFEPGVDLTLQLTQDLEWTGSSAQAKLPAAIAPADELVALVAAEPSRTVAADPPKSSDLTNLMFLGSQEQIKQAFQSGGWFTAAQLGAESKAETARAIIEDRGYKQAPVSILMLDGHPPDLTFQKQTDTFSKRDHIRIWHRPGSFQGQEIWVAAATHDIGIDFSNESKTFTHVIDSNIDAERAKVTDDLLFTGLIQRIALVGRPNLPSNLSNATGDRLETDGKMAVLAF